MKLIVCNIGLKYCVEVGHRHPDSNISLSIQNFCLCVYMCAHACIQVCVYTYVCCYFLELALFPGGGMRRSASTRCLKGMLSPVGCKTSLKSPLLVIDAAAAFLWSFRVFDWELFGLG